MLFNWTADNEHLILFPKHKPLSDEHSTDIYW